MGRTLVLHPGALGDVLLSVPALRALRAAAPGDELVLAAQGRIGSLLGALALVDGHLDFDTLGLDALFADGAPPERLRRLVAGARVVSWFGSKDPGFARRLEALAPGAVVASTLPSDGVAVWEHLVASIETLTAGAGTGRREAIEPPEDVLDAGLRALTDAGWDGGRPLVLMHPGAGGVAKRWPAAGFAELAETVVDGLGAAVVVHEGPADHEPTVALLARLRVPARLLVDPPLETLAGAMRHAALWIGNDSGVTHLAAAVGAPTLALFAEAHLAWRPWAERASVRVVRVDALARPDLDAVVAEAARRLRPRDARALGARGQR